MSDAPLRFQSESDPTTTDFSMDKLKQKVPLAPTVQSGTLHHDPTVTHFHSFFYDTFTWKYPRTTGLMFAASLGVLLLGHYVNILRYAFKGAYITFAATAAFEYLGRPTTGTGFMTQVRPHKYYTIPRENLEMIFAEVHEFLNFVVLEFQRILFVENLTVTVAAFITSLIGYWMVKFMPVWGLTLFADVLLFTIPLVYLQNQELIDHHVKQASSAANDHIQNARGLAGKHTADYSAKAKVFAGDLSGKITGAYQGRQKIGDMPNAPKNDAYATKPTTDPFATKPTSDPFATKPTSDPFATKPTSDPYAMKPTSDPYATKPATDLYAMKPTSDPYATKPATDPYAMKPTSDPYATKPSMDSYPIKPTTTEPVTINNQPQYAS